MKYLLRRQYFLLAPANGSAAKLRKKKKKARKLQKYSRMRSWGTRSCLGHGEGAGTALAWAPASGVCTFFSLTPPTLLIVIIYWTSCLRTAFGGKSRGVKTCWISGRRMDKAPSHLPIGTAQAETGMWGLNPNCIGVFACLWTHSPLDFLMEQFTC